MIQPAGKPRNSTFGTFGDVTTHVDRQPELKKDAGMFTFKEKLQMTLREKEDRKLAQKYDQKSNPGKYRNWEEQPTMKAKAGERDYYSTAKSIMSAQAANYNEIDSPVRPMQRRNQNSIWDSETIANLKKSELSDGERIKAENKAYREQRDSLRKDRTQWTVDQDAFYKRLKAEKEGVQPSAHSVSPASGTHAEYSRKLPSHQFSIFDKGLEKLESKLPELTAGEKIAQNARARRDPTLARERRDAERYEKPSLKTSSLSGRFFENFKSTLENMSKDQGK